jgi:hypothetical protein
VLDYIEEFSNCKFNDGDRDDRIDSTSQAINYFNTTRRVISEYSGTTGNFNIAFRNLDPETKIIIAQHMERNQQSSIVFSVWNPSRGKLHVFGEYLSETSAPETTRKAVALILKGISGGAVQDLRGIRWFGSELMHSKATGDISNLYSAARVRVDKVYNYDEGAAVLRLCRLFGRDPPDIAIHQRCDLLKKQLLSWNYEKTLKEQKPARGNGFARALCLTVAAVWTSGRYKTSVKTLPPYSAARDNAYKAHVKALAGTQESLPGKYAWMQK